MKIKDYMRDKIRNELKKSTTNIISIYDWQCDVIIEQILDKLVKDYFSLEHKGSNIETME